MSWLRRPLAPGEIVGYIIFVAGVLLGIWLVLSPWADNWAYWAHDIPIFLLTTWIVAGSAHRFVRTFLLACVISARSEEHTSELQSRPHLVCRLLLDKKP